MLPMRFFRNMSFTGANVALSLIIFSLFGSVFFLNQYLQSILGYTALESGLFSLPLAVILSLTAANSSWVSERLGTKLTVTLGIALAATGLMMMSRLFHIDTILPTIILSQCVLALGMGLAMSPATNSIMGSVPINKAGIGSAMNDTTRQLGGALGVAVLGTIMNNFYLNGVQVLQGDLPEPIFSAVASSIQAANIVAANPELPAAVASTIVATASDAFIVGMNQGMLIGAFIMYGAALFTLLVLPAKVRPPSMDILHTGEIARAGDLPLPPRTPINGRNGKKPAVAADKESLEI
jgi:MFS family permease